MAKDTGKEKKKTPEEIRKAINDSYIGYVIGDALQRKDKLAAAYALAYEHLPPKTKDGRPNGLIAMALYDFMSAKDPSNTSAGKRAGIEVRNANEALRYASIDDIVNHTTFGSVIRDSKLTDKMVEADGKHVYGELSEKAAEYEAEMKLIEAQYDKEIVKAKGDKKKEEKAEETKKKAEEKIEKKYQGARKALSNLSRLMSARATQTATNLVLRNEYGLGYSMDEILDAAEAPSNAPDLDKI